MEFIVHIDFKGLPLSPEYLCARFAELRDAGATAVLLEWEDMLPFHGQLAPLACPHAFSVGEVAQIVGAALALGLEVIPLVQTLGHVEYVLKHNAFAGVREDADDLGTLCPCDPAAASLVEAMLGQVLALHPHSTRVHIGCDEPTLGANPRTAAGASADPDGLSGVLVEHVMRTAARARDLGRGTLMWHDAAVGMSDSCLRRLLGAGAQLVVWDYRPDLRPGDASLAFADKLLAAGSSAYVATAYKGGDTCDAIVPREADRLANQRAWRAWCDSGTSGGGGSGGSGGGDGRSDRPGGTPPRPIAGVVLTGWSRFGHLAPLTEMLPAAMPTLLRALAVWCPPSEQAAGSEADAAAAAATATAAAEPAVARWREAAGSGARLHAICVAVDGARARLAALEEEWRVASPPAVGAARPAAAPRLCARVRDEARLLASELRDAGKRARADAAIFRGRADAAEWEAAKVHEARARALALARSSQAQLARSQAQGGAAAAATAIATGVALLVAVMVVRSRTR